MDKIEELTHFAQQARSELEAALAREAAKDARIKSLEDYVFELTNKAFRCRPELEIIVGGSGSRDERLGLSLRHDAVKVSFERLEEDRVPWIPDYRTPVPMPHAIRLTIEIETNDRDGRVTKLCQAVKSCGAEVYRG